MPNSVVSSFVVDLPTLGAMTIFVSATAGLLLLLAWAQNRSTPALALWGIGYLVGSAGPIVLASRVLALTPASICIANALLCCAYGVLWGGSRCFEGRHVRLTWMVAGAAIWIIGCQLGPFAGNPPARVMLVSTILAAYVLLSAFEVWHARDRELISRWPTLALLLLHAAFLLARIPLAVALVAAVSTSRPHSPVLLAVTFEALFVFFCLAFLRLAMSKERSELEQRKAARTDQLTGIANRRAFFDVGAPLLDRTIADQRSAALLLFDLDRFKEVNDTVGHQAGDDVLRAFANVASASMRPGDLFGRLGGEEFASLLVNISMAQAMQIAERVRRQFETMRVPHIAEGLTVSVGVALTGDARRDLNALLATADRALYRAKAEGRNRVASAPLALVGRLDASGPSLVPETAMPFAS